MLDHLRLSIPILPVYAHELGKNHYVFTGNLLRLGLNCGSRLVTLDDDGKSVAHDLYVPYDSLGTDFSDMAVKFFDKGINCLPYVELKASPLKLLQGHNVFGFESIELGSIQMLGMLIEAFPDLAGILDFSNTEVLHLDCTYMATLPSQKMIQPVLNYLSNISAGHAKSQNLRYKNYVRWGVQNSRYIGRKVYGKFDEVEKQIKDLKKRSASCQQSLNKLNALYAVKDFADSKLRFEARICKTYLTKNNYPSNLFELIKLQNKQPNLLKELWGIAFNPIFKALEGEHMVFNDDDEVLELLRSKLFTVTSKGNISYRKADKAYQFYKTLKSDGYEKVRSNLAKNTFYDNLRTLLKCGFSKAELQNLANEKSNIIPFVRLVHVDFSAQLPIDYVEPVSEYRLPLVA